MTRFHAVLTGLLLGWWLPATAQAELNIFACEPEWGSLAQTLGGEHVNVFTATTAQQDPHHIQARPGLIAKMRRADLLICTGADLEVGWLPVLLRQAGNDRVQPGRPGHFMASEQLPLLDKTGSVDRSQGDIHPAGNPHIHTDPRNIAKVAQALAARLALIDAANASRYAERHRDFDQRWQAALNQWAQKAAPLRGISIVVDHNSWIYLEHWLGLQQLASLEPKPGIPATVGHLSSVLNQLQRLPARMIIRAAYQPDKSAQWLATRANIPVVTLPFTVGGTDQAKDLFSLYDDTINRLLGAL
ncbi:MAG: zinc ABC transporter substrate-binding protein [Gammaproteobacteria bacterium]|nr:zinc ABC transporter substrate-binding protein [Gammaproteobacteria bacterium]